ncbi:MAG: carboxymuconolactone decarboxylase family protein [Novosphingobium sp.]|nr:carboxymuconolactone decarboxylase family protein [Novosphingobium sp.]
MRILTLGLVMAVTLGIVPANAETGKNDERICMPDSRIQSGPTPFDIKAREAQVASGDQRIAPLQPDEFTAEAKKTADELQAFFGSKEAGIPKPFATMFKHPGLYQGQMKLGLELNQRGTLPPREREMVILRTAWLVRSPFEWGEHVVYGKKLGLTSEEIERITQGSSAPGWNEHDQAILRGVEELMGDHAVSEETWNTLAKTWTEQQLMELPGVVGSYTMTAMIYNSLRFGLLKGNEGFSQR